MNVTNSMGPHQFENKFSQATSLTNKVLFDDVDSKAAICSLVYVPALDALCTSGVEPVLDI